MEIGRPDHLTPCPSFVTLEVVTRPVSQIVRTKGRVGSLRRVVRRSYDLLALAPPPPLAVRPTCPVEPSHEVPTSHIIPVDSCTQVRSSPEESGSEVGSGLSPVEHHLFQDQNSDYESKRFGIKGLNILPL